MNKTPSHDPIKIIEHISIVTLFTDISTATPTFKAGRVVQLHPTLASHLIGRRYATADLTTVVDAKTRADYTPTGSIPSKADWAAMCLADIDGVASKRVFTFATFKGAVELQKQKAYWLPVADAETVIATEAAVALPDLFEAPYPARTYYGEKVITV